MNKLTFPPPNTGNAEVDRTLLPLQNRVAVAVNNLTDKLGGFGSRVEVAVSGIGVISVSHTLGSTPTRWRVVDATTADTIYRSGTWDAGNVEFTTTGGVFVVELW
jgi:hypothetical protein